MRVVSLVPSATEMLYALGVAPVAVSCACDYPPEARAQPAADRSPIDTTADSQGINEQVAEAAAGDGVYQLREDVLREADPDVIVTQGVCDVCAVSDELVRRTVEEMGLDADILATHPHSLSDVFEDLERLGERTGREDHAADLVTDFRSRVDRVREQAPAEGRRVLVTDWMDPVMVAGHWVPEMIEWLGAEYGMASKGERSRPRRFEDVVDYDPEILIVAPCGFDLDEAVGALDDLTDNDGFGELTAVREGEVYAMDGDGYVNRPGPRLVDTFEYVAGILYPETFETPPRDVVRRARGIQTP